MKKLLIIENKDGEMVEIPSRIELCKICEGAGAVDNPAFSNGITSSDWAEMDEESRENYMNGSYDVQCECCHGSGRVLVADPIRLTFAHKRVLVHYRNEQRDELDYQRELTAERNYFAAASGYFP